MKIAVMSSPDMVQDEAEIINEMFRNGLEYYHIRKPDFQEKDMIKYVEKIEEQYRNRLVIHDFYHLSRAFNLRGIHIKRENFVSVFLWLFVIIFKWRYKIKHVSTSFHSLGDIRSNISGFEYVFLTPMFRKKQDGNREMVYSEKQLRYVLKNSSNRIFAMGRTKAEDIDLLKNLKFDGLCLMNTIWREDDPLKTFLDIRNRCNGVGSH